MSKALIEYQRLRDRVDARSAELADIHGDRIRCVRGCSDCCTNLTVFAVEFVSIVQGLRQAGCRPAFAEDRTCGFLDEQGGCTLYPARPIICRTHGLPIAFLNEDGGEAEMAVSFCEKNFVDLDPEHMGFGPDNTLDLDELNQNLCEINEAFCRETGFPFDREQSRFELRLLLHYL